MKERTEWVLNTLQEYYNLTQDEIISLYVSQKHYFDFATDLGDFLWMITSP